MGDTEKKVKISVMDDIGRFDPADILPAAESYVDMMRVASYVKDIDKTINLVNTIKAKGYETTINIMAVSHARENELDEALHQVEKESGVDVVYLVDSFGALYSEQIAYLAKKYKDILKTREIGIHAHNNQQLAFANTIESIINNINYLDGTILGIGHYGNFNFFFSVAHNALKIFLRAKFHGTKFFSSGKADNQHEE